MALRSSKVSEQDLEEMRAEYEQRLGAAERKVYAISKERDALKKGSEKINEYSGLIKEKDAIIKQVHGGHQPRCRSGSNLFLRLSSVVNITLLQSINYFLTNR